MRNPFRREKKPPKIHLGDRAHIRVQVEGGWVDMTMVSMECHYGGSTTATFESSATLLLQRQGVSNF